MQKIYLFLALCLTGVMNVHASEVTVYDGKVKNDWAPFALSYGNGWTESQYVIPESELGELFDKTITGVKYYCDWTSAFTSSMSVNFFMWEEPNSVTSLSGFRSTKSGSVAYSGKVSFVMNNGVCEATITFNQPLTYVGGSLVFYNWSNPAGRNNVSFYGKTVQGACWAGNNEEMGGVMANVGQRNFAPKTTFICEDEPEEDNREVITHIELEGFNPYYFHVGDVWSYASSESVTGAIHPVNASAPYYVPETMGDLYLFYSGNEMYISKDNTTLLKGTYIFDIQVRIDEENGLLYRFPYRDKEGAPTVTVNGQQWEVEEEGYSVYPEDDYCYFFAKSPVFEMVEQGIESVQPSAVSSQKVLREGQLMIERNGKTYNMQGAEVK